MKFLCSKSMKIHEKNSKIFLRKRIREIRGSLKEPEIFSKSLSIESLFFRLSELESLKNLLIYMASLPEVQTRGIIEKCLKKNVSIYLPLVDLSHGKIFFSRVSDFDNGLEKGPFGIFQPKFYKQNLLGDTTDIDLIVVPGMAFDEKGGRLGNGKGFYDKFLATVPPHITIIALAFELQIVDEIILFNHDIPVHKIITEKRIISCAR